MNTGVKNKSNPPGGLDGKCRFTKADEAPPDREHGLPQ
jgi:hypothetical protein